MRPDVVVAEDIDAPLVLLQDVVEQRQQVLHRLVLGDLVEEVQKRLSELTRVLLDDGVARPRVGRAVEARNEVEVLLADHLGLQVGLPVDALGSDVLGALLEDRRGCGSGNRIGNAQR